MNDKIRKAVPLVGALALTASALLTGAGGAMAKKPEPTISPEPGFTGSCGTGNPYSYYANVNLSGNKGRWIFIEASLNGAGGDQMPPTKIGTGPSLVQLTGDGSPATVTVTVTTKKGEPTSATTTTDLISCSVD